MMQTMFDVEKLRLDLSLPQQILQRATKGRPIEGLTG